MKKKKTLTNDEIHDYYESDCATDYPLLLFEYFSCITIPLPFCHVARLPILPIQVWLSLVTFGLYLLNFLINLV